MVRQRADALQLCGETAAGLHPLKSLEVLRSVAARIEDWARWVSEGGSRACLPALLHRPCALALPHTHTHTHICPPHPPARSEEKHGRISLPQLSSTSDGLVSEELCAAAATTANALQAGSGGVRGVCSKGFYRQSGH